MRVYSKAKDKKKPTKPKIRRSPRPAAKPLTPEEQAVSAHVAETFQALGAAVASPHIQAALGAGAINTATDRFPWEVFDQKINAIAGPLEEIVRRSLVIPHLMPKAVVLQTNFNHLDPRVALVARTQASKLAASMSREQYAKVRTIIGNGVAKGDTSRQIGRQLRAHIGLNARQDRQMATARLDATQAAIDAGLEGDALDASVQGATDSLYTKMLNYRANMIARTETMAAQNQGLMLGIQQSYEDPQSSVDNTYLKRWIATDDERTCETCGAVDGTEVPLDENFVLDDGTEVGYPLEDGSSPHPNCRCTVGLVPPDRSVSDLVDQTDAASADAEQMAMDFASSMAPSQEIIDMALRMFRKDYNPDQPRDDHGRWTSDGGNSGDSAGPNASSVAADLVTQARAVEPRLTATVTDLAKANGGTLVALDTRVKGANSLTEKINKDVAQFDMTPAEVGAKLFDVNRYTMTLPDGQYVASSTQIIGDMQSQGMDLNVKNFWTNDNNPFMGVNIQAIDNTGTRFELQLQTPTSFEIKVSDLHPAYKAFGVSSDPVVRDSLMTQMHQDAARIPVPTGVESIPSGKLPAL